MIRVQTSGGIVGIVVIIIGVAICLSLLGFFSGQKPYGLPSYRQSLNLPCGLTVKNPEPESKIDFPIIISGFANGCGWELDNTDSVGTVEILSGTGIVLHRSSLKKKQDDNEIPVYFEKTINLSVPTGQKRGFVVFKNNGLGISGRRVEIPVSFK